MKRILLILLSSMLAFALASCSSAPPAATNETTDATTPSETGSTVDASNSNILIAYFSVAENSTVDAKSSASVVQETGRGFIATLADTIQNEVGGEMFSIQTSVRYPAKINEVIDFAAKEQDDMDRPELTATIENLEAFNTVFIGFPNWWYDMPMVMYSFFEEYDFSGKTIIPFCTHNGSQFSSTIQTIQELEPNATVITAGFTVNFKDVPNSTTDVIEWLNMLDV